MATLKFIPKQYTALEVTDHDFSYERVWYGDSDDYETYYLSAAPLTIQQLFDVYFSIPMTVQQVKLTHRALSDIELVKFYVLACQKFSAMQDIYSFLNRIESISFKTMLPLNLTRKFPIEDTINILGLISDLLKWLKNPVENKSNVHLLFTNPASLLVSSSQKQNTMTNMKKFVKDLIMTLVPLSQVSSKLDDIKNESDVIHAVGNFLKLNEAKMQIDGLNQLKSIFAKYFDLTAKGVKNDGIEMTDYAHASTSSASLSARK